MIYDGMLFHNVEDMIPVEDGLRLCRVPPLVREKLNPGARDNTAFHCSGVEIRFRMLSEEVKVYLRTDDDTEALPALIYYGPFQGTWTQSARTIGKGRSCVDVKKPQNIAYLHAAQQGREKLFDPDMVRIVLPYSACVYMGVEGRVEPPHAGDATPRRCLSYGSSITHGSLALGAHQSYAFMLARSLGCDSINLGFAGTCHLEKDMAEYIVSRRDWDVATLEMGINMLSRFTEEEFARRVRDFVAVMAADGRPVYATSLFGFMGENEKKGEAFREIVRRETAGKLPFIDGLDLMGDNTLLAEDLVHPSVEGHRMIAQRWSAFIRGQKS